MATPAVDWSPLWALLGVGALLAALVLLGLAWRQRAAPWPARWAALLGLTVFLTFDLIVFGAFTRLSDSGLGCPDWPGCYGSASPLGAHDEISQAQAAMPHGPVTHRKAWVEMIHRYLASGVGALILVMAVGAPFARRQGVAGVAPGWVLFTLLWVCVQGAFGAFTVTWKLYPLVVTLHLLGGMGLLMLLALQAAWLRPRPPLSPALWRGTLAVTVLCLLQVALGAWVSANYAVLACPDFPTCHGRWWPAMDFGAGFTFRRPLGLRGEGGAALPVEALVAIHWTHRLGALLVAAAVGALAAALWRAGQRRHAGWLLALLTWQVLTGLSNVVLGWPLAAALGHTAGAAALLARLSLLLARRVAAAPRSVHAPAAGFLKSHSHHV